MADSSLLYGRIIKVHIGDDSGTLQFTNDLFEIRFEVPFDHDSKPNVSTVQIFNLTKDTINKIKKDKNITVIAGYAGDYGVLVEGKITRALTKYEGVDKITTITFKEGTDYSGVKVTSETADPAEKYYVKKRIKGKTAKVEKNRKQTMQITFAKGVTGKQIITRLTGILGIKPTEISLPKDKVYKTGYKVTGKIEDSLLTVVKDCGARMYWRRGKMVIRSIEAGNDERFELSEETGLIETPSEFEDDEGKGYTVRCLLQHRITIASIIDIKSSSANGKFRARAGKHYCDGTDFATDFEVI
ncbi:phage protein [Metabacillus fastidiosus]|uniref:phage protein n=1 Tax=Metabacillus fastidiosus TaxID=1458 RepID=UPI002E1A2914|nr:hypothetical protein [Metabacillus fastidiosus]